MDPQYIPGLGSTDQEPTDGPGSSRDTSAPLTSKRSADTAGLKADGYDQAPHKQAKQQDGPVKLDEIVQVKLDELVSKGVLRPDELDALSLRELAEFSPNAGVQVLDQFEQSDLSTVRNKSGYLGGVMTRLRRQAGPKLHPDIQNRLDNMFRARKLKATDLDAKCYDNLNTVSVGVAVAALDRFAARDLREVRNYSAFLIAQLRAAEKQVFGEPQGGHHSSYGLIPHPNDRHSSRSSYGGASQSAYAPPPPRYSQASPPAYGSAAPAYAQGRGGGGGGGGRSHQGHEQRLAGVRVEEFHGLADATAYVPAPVALKLQNLWDAGVKLVSMLDDRSWEVLADMGAPEGLATVNEVAMAMDRQGGLRNVNAYFMSLAGKMMGSSRGVGGGGGGGGPPQMVRERPAPSSYEHSPPTGYSGGYSGSAVGGYSGSAVGGYSGSRGSSRDDYGGGGGSRRDPRGDRDGGGGGGGSRGGPAGATRGVSAMGQLSHTLQHKAESVIAAASSYLTSSHFDEGVVSALNRLGERSAMQVLEEVLVNDLGTVRNIPAYIMGICKRHRDRKEGH